MQHQGDIQVGEKNQVVPLRGRVWLVRAGVIATRIVVIASPFNYYYRANRESGIAAFGRTSVNLVSI